MRTPLKYLQYLFYVQNTTKLNLHSISSGFENMAQEKGDIGVIWRYYKPQRSQIDVLIRLRKFGVTRANWIDFSNAPNIFKI